MHSNGRSLFTVIDSWVGLINFLLKNLNFWIGEDPVAKRAWVAASTSFKNKYQFYDLWFSENFKSCYKEVIKTESQVPGEF